MFTGIVEHTGLVRSCRAQPGGKRLEIELGKLADGTQPGDSIAVNGVCLTVTAINQTLGVFDVSRESLNRSTLGTLQAGSKVNLERALRADGRFGGHFVQGHVDGVGRIASIRRQAEFAEFRVEAPAALLVQMTEKGSVAVDGISLTIASMDQTGFTVALIPATLAHTTWKESKAGDPVNIETDILVKIIQKQLRQLAGEKSSLTPDLLKQMGY
jgi:riboflavin synthase